MKVSDCCCLSSLGDMIECVCVFVGVCDAVCSIYYVRRRWDVIDDSVHTITSVVSLCCECSNSRTNQKYMSCITNKIVMITYEKWRQDIE